MDSWRVSAPRPPVRPARFRWPTALHARRSSRSGGTSSWRRRSCWSAKPGSGGPWPEPGSSVTGAGVASDLHGYNRGVIRGRSTSASSLAEIAALLASVRRRWMAARAMRAVARVSSAALLALALVLGVDRLFAPADLVMAVLAACAAGAAAAFTVRTLWPLRRGPADWPGGALHRRALFRSCRTAWRAPSISASGPVVLRRSGAGRCGAPRARRRSRPCGRRTDGSAGCCRWSRRHGGAGGPAASSAPIRWGGSLAARGCTRRRSARR